MAEQPVDLSARLKGLKELLESGDLSQEEFDAQRSKLVQTGGSVAGAGITIGTDAALAFTKFMLRQQAINRMREQQARDSKQLTAPTLTDKDLATINVLSDAAVREAKASGARTGGGLDAERLRAAQDIALKKAATFLSKKQAGEISGRKALSSAMGKRSEAIASAAEQQRSGLVDDIAKSLGNEEVAQTLFKAGQTGRKKKSQGFDDAGDDFEKMKQDEDKSRLRIG
tara:strand:- start:1835 stop:2518 length:684 start_codon:yes stop_codon:yes gene_type:complete